VSLYSLHAFVVSGDIYSTSHSLFFGNNFIGNLSTIIICCSFVTGKKKLCLDLGEDGKFRKDGLLLVSFPFFAKPSISLQSRIYSFCMFRLVSTSKSFSLALGLPYKLESGTLHETGVKDQRLKLLRFYMPGPCP
jgi:hypothetical protein